MICDVCNCDSLGQRVGVLDSDRAREPFALLRCVECRSARFEIFPAQDVLNSYYDESYYGRGGAKFSAPLQVVMDTFSRSLARSIHKYIDAVYMPKILDIGCGRGVLLKHLAQMGGLPGQGALGLKEPSFSRRIITRKSIIESARFASRISGRRALMR